MFEPLLHVHLLKSEQNTLFLGSASKAVAGVGHLWRAQCQRHVHQRCYEVRALICWDPPIIILGR